MRSCCFVFEICWTNFSLSFIDFNPFYRAPRTLHTVLHIVFYFLNAKFLLQIYLDEIHVSINEHLAHCLESTL